MNVTMSLLIFALFGCLESVNFLLLKQGKCMKQVQDVIERLWDFIDKLDINTFGELVTTRGVNHKFHHDVL